MTDENDRLLSERDETLARISTEFLRAAQRACNALHQSQCTDQAYRDLIFEAMVLKPFSETEITRDEAIAAILAARITVNDARAALGLPGIERTGDQK